MDEIEVYNQLSAIATPTFAVTFGDDSDQAIRIAEHKAWLGSIRRERPGIEVKGVSAFLDQPRNVFTVDKVNMGLFLEC